jgi:Flp pilus assembly protein TadD
MAQLRYLPWVLATLLAAGCSQSMVKSTPLAAETATTSAADEPDADYDVASTPESLKPIMPVDENLPKQALTPEILYQFLLAEIAGQRGEIALSRAVYLELAKKTRDPRVARRAAEIAVFSRDPTAALAATRIWSETDQDSARANQTLAALLLAQGNLDDATPVVKRMLASNAPGAFMDLPSMLSKTADQQAALTWVQGLAAAYPALPEAQFAVAQAAASASKPEVMQAALDRANSMRPGWEPAALYRAQWIAKTSRDEALGYMRDFLTAYPAARELRLAYARLLVHANQYTEARAQFTRLTGEFPRNPDVMLAAALLSLQMGDTQAAQSQLDKTLEYGYKNPDTVHYYLGLLGEATKQPDAAITHYQQVRGGEYLVRARARQAALLAQQGKLDAGRQLLVSTQTANDAQRIELIQAEADLLRDAKDYPSAYAVLSAGIKRFPDTTDLLYDQAMMAEKLSKIAEMETNLRRVIELKPDEAQAYNALGYTLADRTNRLDEAVVLLDKALALAPNDPFILDSMGWAQYRKGNFERARDYLDRAYKARPDPEIAAHLGEVLWSHGQHQDADSLWKTALKSSPQNEMLLETIHRLNP